MRLMTKEDIKEDILDQFSQSLREKISKDERLEKFLFHYKDRYKVSTLKVFLYLLNIALNGGLSAMLEKAPSGSTKRNTERVEKLASEIGIEFPNSEKNLTVNDKKTRPIPGENLISNDKKNLIKIKDLLDTLLVQFTYGVTISEEEEYFLVSVPKKVLDKPVMTTKNIFQVDL